MGGADSTVEINEAIVNLVPNSSRGSGTKSFNKGSVLLTPWFFPHPAFRKQEATGELGIEPEFTFGFFD